MESESEKRGELSPLRLAEKLKRIRAEYGLTQGKMLLIINPTESDESNRARVSQYENGVRVPSLVEVYNYARFAGVTVEMLLNDNLDLPAMMQQSKSDSNKGDISPVGNEAVNSEIKNDDGSFNGTDVSSAETATESEKNSLSEVSNGELLRTQSDAGNNDRSASAAVYSIRLSKEISDDGKAVFINQLSKLPFNKMGRITQEKFLEQTIAAGLEDYHARRTESALARRMQLLFEDEIVD